MSTIEALYEDYAVGVRDFLQARYSLDRETAADLVQDAFFDLLRQHSTLAGLNDAQQHAYLMRTAVHSAIDVKRRQQTPFGTLLRNAVQIDDPSSMAGNDLIDPSSSPEDLVLSRERWASVRDLLKPLEFRALQLELRDYTGKEMAQIIGKSVPAIKMLVSRSRKKLRAAFQAESAGVA